MTGAICVDERERHRVENSTRAAHGHSRGSPGADVALARVVVRSTCCSTRQANVAVLTPLRRPRVADKLLQQNVTVNDNCEPQQTHDLMTGYPIILIERSIVAVADKLHHVVDGGVDTAPIRALSKDAYPNNVSEP